MTERLFLEDAYQRVFEAAVIAVRDDRVALSRTAFYPGGGGQPADQGWLSVGGRRLTVTDVRAEGEVWHLVDGDVASGAEVRGELDWPRRYALMRAHALMHVVNTVARERHDGWITGVQLGVERSRIDLRLDGFSRALLPALEDAVNAVLAAGLAIGSTSVSEEEFRRRPELVRTLEVTPPVVDGRVRVVEIAGFDAQACGGTHPHSTSEVGVARIVRFDNKGRDNKRIYWELEPAR